MRAGIVTASTARTACSACYACSRTWPAVPTPWMMPPASDVDGPREIALLASQSAWVGRASVAPAEGVAMAARVASETESCAPAIRPPALETCTHSPMTALRLLSILCSDTIDRSAQGAPGRPWLSQRLCTQFTLAALLLPPRPDGPIPPAPCPCCAHPSATCSTIRAPQLPFCAVKCCQCPIVPAHALAAPTSGSHLHRIHIPPAAPARDLLCLCCAYRSASTLLHAFLIYPHRPL